VPELLGDTDAEDVGLPDPLVDTLAEAEAVALDEDVDEAVALEDKLSEDEPEGEGVPDKDEVAEGLLSDVVVESGDARVAVAVADALAVLEEVPDGVIEAEDDPLADGELCADTEAAAEAEAALLGLA